METITGETDDDVYQSVAQRLGASVLRALQRDGTCAVGLVGGRSTPRILDFLVPDAQALEGKGKILVLWLDERVHEEKNYTSIIAQLERIRAAGVSIAWHPLKSIDTDGIVRDAKDALVALQALKGSIRLDVALLSSGEDGHVASIFPGSPVLDERESKYVIVENVPKPPPIRITATPALIRSASDGYVLFIGDKRDAYERFMDPGTTLVSLPVKIALDIPHLVVGVRLS